MTNFDLSPQDASQTLPIAVLVDREGLGDALLKLPFLRAVKRAWPDRPVWWIATHQTAMAHELAPWTGELIDRTIQHAKLTAPARDVIARLRRLPEFDLVFDSRTRFASVLVARRSLTYRGFYACLPLYLLSSRRPRGQRARPPGIAARMLSLVEAATGRPPEWHGEFAISAAAAHLALFRLPEGPTYVGLAPGSRESRKNWPLASFIALAERLEDAGLTPAFLIGPQERDKLDVLRASFPSGLFPEADPIDPSVGLRPLELAIAIAGRLSAAVATDSGIGHLLGAVGTPLVSLFGPTDADRWRPVTSNGTVVRAQAFGGSAMEKIPVAAVFSAVRSLIAGRPVAEAHS